MVRGAQRRRTTARRRADPEAEPPRGLFRDALALAVTAGAVIAALALGVINNHQLLAGDAVRYGATLAAPPA